MRTTTFIGRLLAAVVLLFTAMPAAGGSLQDSTYNPGPMTPIDSRLKVRVGDQAPDFSLPSVQGGAVSLSGFKGRKNVVLSFVPAAWTPVCSQQWPDFNRGREAFEKNDAVLLGISADNIPSLYAWTRQMGELWFPVLSDFWPHGATAAKFGVLRTDGMTERAVIIIDKQGVIRYIDVHDINRRPLLVGVILELGKVGRSGQ